MRHWTADLHFGHRLVSGLRGYSETEEHDERVVQTINKHVSVDDQLWILGDLTLKRLSKVTHLLERIECENLMLVLGNHDTAHPEMRGWENELAVAQEFFKFVGTSAAIRVEGTHIMMSHFPYSGDHTEEDRFSQWRLPDAGRFLLHGHTHSSVKNQFSNSLHVGWDAWGRPVRESEVMKAFRESQSK